MRAAWIIAALAGSVAIQPALADNRPTALLADFTRWCVTGSISFQSVTAAATAKDFPLASNTRTPFADGDYLESKVWDATDDPASPYALMVSDGVKDGEVVDTTCGIGMDSPNTDMLAALQAAPGYGKPKGRKIVNGSPVYFWPGPYPHTEIQLIEINAGTPTARTVLRLDKT